MNFIRRKSTLYVFFTGIFLGSTLVMSRFGLKQLNAMTFVSLRLLLGSVAFLVAYFVFRVRPWPRDRALWLKATIFGLVGTGICMTGFTNSLLYQSSGVTALLATLGPVVTAILAHLFLHDEPFTRKRLLGALIAFVGAGLLLVKGENGLSQFAQADWRGYAWAMVGVVSNAAALVYARRYLRSADPFYLSSIRVFSGAAAIILVTAGTGGLDFRGLQLSGFLAAIYAAVIGTFFAFYFYATTVVRYGATIASQTEYIVPMAATLLGMLLLGEQVTVTMLVGMAVIFVGLGVFSQREPAAIKEVLQA